MSYNQQSYLSYQRKIGIVPKIGVVQERVLKLLFIQQRSKEDHAVKAGKTCDSVAD